MTSSTRRALIVAGSILGLLALSGVGLVALNSVIMASYGPKHDPVRTVRTSAMELRRAAETWRAAHAGSPCPTPESLRADGAIDAASRLTDPWGSPFRIFCERDDVVVVSFGPDGRQGTADDVRSPERSTPAK